MSGPLQDTIGEAEPCLTVRMESPDGTMFVTIVEGEGLMPSRIMVHIGKSGSSLAAWASCAAEFVSEAIPRIGLNTVIAKLLGISSDKISYVPDSVGDNGVITVRSGPEAIAYALIKYRLHKHKEFMRGLDIEDSDDDEDTYRGPSAA